VGTPGNTFNLDLGLVLGLALGRRGASSAASVTSAEELEATSAAGGGGGQGAAFK
jgi:hypothetical protein